MAGSTLGRALARAGNAICCAAALRAPHRARQRTTHARTSHPHTDRAAPVESLSRCTCSRTHACWQAYPHASSTLLPPPQPDSTAVREGGHSSSSQGGRCGGRGMQIHAFMHYLCSLYREHKFFVFMHIVSVLTSMPMCVHMHTPMFSAPCTASM